MYLRSIQLENYRKFEFAQTDFPDGIVGVIGNNGVGKSTLVEAIAWALYGNEASRTTKEEIKRLTAKPADVCRVILEFELTGNNFRVVRQIKGETSSGDASVIVDGNVVARGIKAVKDYVEKTLGMDYKAFITSFYAPQKELNVLSDFQPYKRKELLVRMLGIENIDSALKLIREDKRELEIKSETASALLKDLKSLKTGKKEKEGNLNQLRRNTSEKETELKQISSSLHNAEADLIKMKEKYEKNHQLNQKLEVKKTEESTLISQLAERNKEKEKILQLTQKIENLKPKIDKHKRVKEEITGLDQLKLKAEKIKITQQQIDQLQKSISVDRKRLDELTSKLKEKQMVEAKLNQSKGKIDQLEVDLEKTRKKYVHLQTSFKTLTEDKKKLDKQLGGIEELGPDSVCDRCLRPMGEDYEKIRAHLLEELSKLEKDLSRLKEEKDKIEARGKKLKEQKDKLEKEKEEIRNEWEGLLRSVGEEENLKKSLDEKNGNLSLLNKTLEQIGKIDYDPDEHQRLKTEFENLENVKEEYTKIAQDAKRLPEVEQRIKQIRERIELLKKQEQELNQKIKELDFSEKNFREVEKRFEELRTKTHQVEFALKDLIHQTEICQNELKRIETDIEQTKKQELEIKRFQEEKLYLEKLDNIFSDFRVSLIDRIKPTLSGYAKELFSELTDGRYLDFELDEDYEIFIYDNGEKFSIERFSGGEKDLANLCLRLAISLMISESSGVDFSFIILDEIFGSQDQARKESILNGLAKLKNRFRQIFLITHIDDIKDSVENLITVVENEDGTSRMLLQ
jgi:exonuclease SbcC